VRAAAGVGGVGLGGVTAAGTAIALASVGKGGAGEDFLGTRGDDTLVLLEEIDDDRDLRPGVGPAPARLFNGFAAEGDLLLPLGEREVRGVLLEFLRTLEAFNERSRPITGRAGVAPPPSVVVVPVPPGRGRS
jgi:hypothetical protein